MKHYTVGSTAFPSAYKEEASRLIDCLSNLESAPLECGCDVGVLYLIRSCLIFLEGGMEGNSPTTFPYCPPIGH